jgi:hypothetical protein
VRFAEIFKTELFSKFKQKAGCYISKIYDIMKSIFWLDEVMNMGNSRDDFTSATKELLANRVGRRCSNPACRKLTCGANTNPEKITNIGVAAHICAAAQGGPRYDASMTPEERKVV